MSLRTVATSDTFLNKRSLNFKTLQKYNLYNWLKCISAQTLYLEYYIVEINLWRRKFFDDQTFPAEVSRSRELTVCLTSRDLVMEKY